MESIWYHYKNLAIFIKNPEENKIKKIEYNHSTLMQDICKICDTTLDIPDFDDLCFTSRTTQHIISRIIHKMFDGEYGFVSYENNILILYKNVVC